MNPYILINFKTYPEAIGNKAVKLAKAIAKVKSDKYSIAIAPTLLTLREVANKADITVISQHMDTTMGSHTGSIPVEELKEIGVYGTLLNHSERKIEFSKLKRSIQLCQANELKVIVCSSDIEETKQIAELKPDFIAYEPAELIGGDISVTKAQPDIIKRAVKAIKSISPETKVLCGAGIQGKEDIKAAIELGTSGVLIGHAASQAKDPRKFMEDLLS
jgi:triosephosphate isomerase (TIM)